MEGPRLFPLEYLDHERVLKKHPVLRSKHIFRFQNRHSKEKDKTSHVVELMEICVGV